MARARLNSKTLAIALLACSMASGCAAIGLAPIASVANFGYAAWVGSRLRFVEDAGFDPVTLAAERALVGLDLEVELTSEHKSDGVVRLRVYQVRSERGDLAILRLRRLSPTMTDLTLDVGIGGNRPAAELIADHIRWYVDGDTIRAARRAAMEAILQPEAQPGEPPVESPPDQGEAARENGPHFGLGLL
ncbi:MAG: hypothetical protein AAFV77_05700 [Planctomycetota bacterium]